MVVGQPLLQSRRQQQLLVGVVGRVGLAHRLHHWFDARPIIPLTPQQTCFSDGLLVRLAILHIFRCSKSQAASIRRILERQLVMFTKAAAGVRLTRSNWRMCVGTNLPARWTEIDSAGTLRLPRRIKPQIPVCWPGPGRATGCFGGLTKSKSRRTPRPAVSLPAVYPYRWVSTESLWTAYTNRSALRLRTETNSLVIPGSPSAWNFRRMSW